jgi:hypothetical protein
MKFTIFAILIIAMAAGTFSTGRQTNTNMDADGNPRADMIPANNSDLDDIISKAEAIKAFAQSCLTMECPELDCEHARIIRDNLADAKSYLEFLIRWLQKANDAHMAHFQSLVEMGKITGENLARTQTALAWQKFLHDMGSNLLDIASVADFVKGFMEGPEMARGIDEWKKMDDDLTVNRVLGQIDSFYEALKDFESGMDNISGNLAGGEGTGTPLGDATPESLLGMSQGDINNHKSTLSDIKNTIEEAVKNGKDWRKTLRNGGAAAIGQIAGRYLKAYNEKLMKERQQRIDSLVNDLAASDVAQSQSYRNLQKVQNRRFKAEDTLKAVEEAIEALSACMSKADCPLESVARKGFDVSDRLNDFVQVGPGGEQVESWGWALEVFNRMLNEVRPRLSPPYPDLEDNCPEDSTEDATYGALNLSDLNGVRIGNESPKWCKTTDGTPTFVPLDGVDPRDIPVPGTMTPPGTEPQPRDISPGMLKPPETAGPPSTQLDPSDELEYLQSLATRLEFLIIDPDLTEEERGRVEKVLTDIKIRMLELHSELMDEEEEDSRDVAEPETTQPPETFVPTVTIYVKAKTNVLIGVQDAAQGVVGQQVKLFAASVTNPALPGDGNEKPQTDHALGPIQGTTDDKGNVALQMPMTALGMTPTAEQPLNAIGGPAFQVTINPTPQSSVNVKVGGGDPQAAVASIPDSARSFLVDVNKVNGSVFLTFTFPTSMEDSMNKILVSIPGVVNIEINICKTKQPTLDDPYFKGKGGWGQSYDDQWAIKRVGLTEDESSAWNKLGENPEPVIVAVIDSGLDWNHLDFDWKNLWQNPNEIPNNRKDDDDNGYVDDMIGWNFLADSNKPWDHDGHGTIVSGIIAASRDNGIGMTGINPYARIMVCKALNNFGNTRASYLAKAIVYAVDNGARVINMSVGGKGLAQIEQEAVANAVSKGVLIVVASGNEGVNVEGFGIAGMDGVLTVASAGLDDKRSVFSNWGSQVDIAAPGIDILGLRARLTDTMQDIPGVEYVNGANFVGEDNRYYRGSGTSFAAPIVTGIASLIMSKHPEYTAVQVAQILKQSATDIDVPGVDQFSGYGLVNAAAALDASPEFLVQSVIERVEVAQGEGGPVVQVFGTADADLFQKATIAIGAGDNPTSWKDVGDVKQSVKSGLLGSIPANQFIGAKVWMIRLTTEHQSGGKREFRFRLSVG